MPIDGNWGVRCLTMHFTSVKFRTHANMYCMLQFLYTVPQLESHTKHMVLLDLKHNPSYSNSVAEVLPHSNRVTLPFSISKQLIALSSKRRVLYTCWVLEYPFFTTPIISFFLVLLHFHTPDRCFSSS